MSSPVVAPYGAYPTADGHLVVLGTTNDQEWRRLSLDMLGRPDLADDPLLSTNELRCAQRQRIDDEIGKWTTARSAEDILRSADDCRIGSARFNSISEVTTHPQLSSRGRWIDVASPVGPVTTISPPFTNPAWPLATGPIPGLGEQTNTILTELELSADEIADLRRAGIV